MEVIVEKNIPIPVRTTPFITTLLGMEYGDSFLVKTERERAIVFIAAKRLGVKFTGRKVENGIRLWKIASQNRIEKKDQHEITYTKRIWQENFSAHVRSISL